MGQIAPEIWLFQPREGYRGFSCSKIGAYWKIGAYDDVVFDYRRMSLFSRKYSILIHSWYRMTRNNWTQSIQKYSLAFKPLELTFIAGLFPDNRVDENYFRGPFLKKPKLWTWPTLQTVHSFTRIHFHVIQPILPSRTVFCQWLPIMIDHDWHWIKNATKVLSWITMICNDLSWIKMIGNEFKMQHVANHCLSW